MLFVPVVLVVVELLRRRHVDAARWVLLLILLAAVTGAKATYLPILIVGLVVAIATDRAAGRGWHVPAMSVLAATALCALWGQAAIFKGASLGMRIEPFGMMRQTVVDVARQAGFAVSAGAPTQLVVAVTLIFILSWVCIWSAAAGLASNSQLSRAEVGLVLGLGAAGLCAAIVLWHPGGAEVYFLQASRPYLAIASVCGATAWFRRSPASYRVLAIAAAATGACMVWLLRGLGGQPATGSLGDVGRDLAWPFATALFLVGAILIAARRSRVPAKVKVALIAALAFGCCLPTAADLIGVLVGDAQKVSAAHGTPNEFARLTRSGAVSPGGRQAGRWLRDHSRPEDLVATNAHCLSAGAKRCSNTHFWISAFAERRILIEGWGFTATSHRIAEEEDSLATTVPYWNPKLLAHNDAAFRSPSARTVGLLRKKYGVRWLFVDEAAVPHSPDIGRFAELRYRSGTCAVYELTQERSARTGR
jgi:hypothetical protein